MGRPPTVDWHERWLSVLPLLASGQSLTAVARALNVNRTALLAVLPSYPDIADSYARTLQARIAGEADALVELSDDRSIPADDRRLMLDTRKWVASKLLPKVYGDRLTVDQRTQQTVEIVVRHRGRDLSADVEAVEEG